MNNPSTQRIVIRTGIVAIIGIAILLLLTRCDFGGKTTGGEDHISVGDVKCPGNCEDIFSPVCGDDGETYMNPCLAKCAGITVIESDECMLCEKSTQEYQAIGMQKVRLLNEYISIILNDGTNNDGPPTAEVDTAINEAVKLFVSENSTVEITNANETISFAIRDYLNRIKNYSPARLGEIEIKWSEIGYVSKLKPGPDRNFYGVITVTQKFRRSVDGITTYEDITRKDIEIILKTYALASDGKYTIDCEVFLSNIGVRDFHMVKGPFAAIQ